MSFDLTNAFVFILIGAVLVALAIWLLFRANRKTTVVGDDSDSAAKDVLDEGAAPATRNQALIDAPKAVDVAVVSGVPEPQPAPEPEPAPVAAPTSEQAPAPAPEAAPTPAAAAEPAAEPATAASADDLRQIKGLGPKLVTILAEQGITTFAQIAAWSDEDVARIDATLGRFEGRITRDQWVEQAKLLVSGDNQGFSDKFGQNG